MLVGISILALSILIAWYEVPRLWKQGCKKEVWLYISLMLLGNTLATLKGMGKALPNPADWITLLMAPLTKLLLQIGLINK
ncbi:hypothetical protein [Paenibacillus aceris]|uniref:Holin n=1 Tax=Paenibacillus aceris TaxID=869555 RepID=A0ABS4I3C7_9BACL|nr:hypothetical protein [Paenibacillus aceris]MBP1965419.1 hypothetical protein [Paenibacillus aceris]NHW33530.1 hypothetical protein [Paenibacillus aceris]